MARNPRRIDAEMDALYGQLPKIDCQGYCHDSCGPIEMSVRERQRIESEHGPITCDHLGPNCSMLDGERRCRAYATRPMICRLWGLMEAMPCHFGCRPEGGLLSNSRAAFFIAEADRIGGVPSGRAEHLVEQLERQRELLGDAELKATLDQYAAALVPRPTALGQASVLHIRPRTQVLSKGQK